MDFSEQFHRHVVTFSLNSMVKLSRKLRKCCNHYLYEWEIKCGLITKLQFPWKIAQTPGR